MTSRSASPGFRMILLMLSIMVAINLPVSAQTGERFSFEFRNVTLDHALYQISQTTGADIIYESHLTSGMRVSAVYQNEQLGTVLNNLLNPSGLEARRIRTGMYVLRFSLRRELEPLMRVSGDEINKIPSIRDEDRVHTGRYMGPLRDRPMFWQ